MSFEGPVLDDGGSKIPTPHTVRMAMQKGDLRSNVVEGYPPPQGSRALIPKHLDSRGTAQGTRGPTQGTRGTTQGTRGTTQVTGATTQGTRGTTQGTRGTTQVTGATAQGTRGTIQGCVGAWPMQG